MLKTLGTAFSASVLCLGFAATSAFATPTETSSKGFTGNADWYSDYYHGKKTASGERHDKTKFMAAHRTLPFGTKLLVTNHRTGKECVVTVNDRGPYTPNRVIDLSYAAAKHLGITGGSKMLEYKIVSKDTKVTDPADLTKPAKSLEVASASKSAAKAGAVAAASTVAKSTDVSNAPIWVKTADVVAATKPAKSSDVATVSPKPAKSSDVATVSPKPAKSSDVATVALKPAKSSDIVTVAPTPAKTSDIATVAPKAIKPSELTVATKTIPTTGWLTIPSATETVAVARPTVKTAQVVNGLKSAPIPGIATAETEQAVPSALTTHLVPKSAVKKEVALDPSTVED